MHGSDVKTWSKEFETGIRAIDNDHKGLFEDIRFLGEALETNVQAKQIESAIASLENYCREHFGREEAFMTKAHYPDTQAHIREHRRMTRQIAQLRTLYAADPKQVDGTKVHHFLSSWLSGHILGTDMRYLPYLRGDKRGTPSSETEAFRKVSIAVPTGKSKVVSDFVRIVESDQPVANELALAIEQLERRLKAQEFEDAKRLFCRS